MFDRLTYAVDDGIASIAFCHPEKLNVLSRQLLVELVSALQMAEAAQAKVIVLTAEGRAFSSGGDLSDPSTHAGELGAILAEAYHPAMQALMAMPMPVICGVNGKAVGGSCGLALACDVVVAAANASFDFAFARIGLVPDCGVAWLLPRIVGRSRARAILLGGRSVGADEALSIGMVAQIVPGDALAATLDSVARSFAATPGGGLRLAKQLIGYSESASFPDVLRAEMVAQQKAGASDEFRATLRALDERQRQ